MTPAEPSTESIKTDRYRTWFAISLFVCMFVGCETGELIRADPSAEVSTSEANTITDRLDRKFTIGAPATRIISLSPATTELLFALGLGPSMVGATEYCNYPAEALDVPRVGGGMVDSISLEAIVSAEPDLVLTQWDTHEPLVESLDRMNIRSFAVGAQSLDELFEETTWLGQITDRKQQAATLIDSMKSRRDRLIRVVKQARPTPQLKVFYEVWDSPLMTAGPDSFIDELLCLAGLKNIISDTSIQYPQISSETVLKGDPDLILAPASHLVEIDIDSIRSRPGWEGIKAVRNKRIHLISGDTASRCGPRTLDALAEIISAAYPEVKSLEVAP